MRWRKFIVLFVIVLPVSLFACAADDSLDVGAQTEPIVTGCDPALPPCACALAGQPQCRDDDGDGIPNISDNCAHTYNPAQADCDGDGIGDACDTANVIVNPENPNYTVFAETLQSAYQMCVGPSSQSTDGGQLYWFQQWTELRVYSHVEQNCGPSGDTTRTVLRTVEYPFSCARLEDGSPQCLPPQVSTAGFICPPELRQFEPPR